jgi:hypothetical protein
MFTTTTIIITTLIIHTSYYTGRKWQISLNFNLTKKIYIQKFCIKPFSKQKEKGDEAIACCWMSPGQCSHLLDTKAGSQELERL